MSGGHWDYQQERLRDFADTLQSESDPTIAAAGRHLSAIADVLHDLDWILSADTSRDKWSDHIATLKRLIGPEYVRDEKLTKALKAIAELGQ